MSREIKKIFKKLASVPGVCGYETARTDAVRELLDPARFEISRDTLGNLIAKSRTEGDKKIMISVPIDSPGLLVTFIDSEGRLRVSAIGSPSLQSLSFRRVISQSGRAGVVTPLSDGKISSDADLFIDVGAKSKADAERVASIGDVFSLEGCVDELVSGRLCSGAAGAAACATAAVIAADSLSEIDAELYIVFTAQSRVGYRGARTAAAAISPDLSISLFPACFDGKSHEGQDAVRIGDGIVALLRDGSAIASTELCSTLTRSPLARKIRERVSRDPSTDASVIAASGGGSATLSLCIPTKNPATPAETVDTSDVALAADALALLVRSI